MKSYVIASGIALACLLGANATFAANPPSPREQCEEKCQANETKCMDAPKPVPANCTNAFDACVKACPLK